MAELATRWYTRAAGADRLALEYLAVHERFPGFRLSKDKSGSLYWVGDVVTSFGVRYGIKICYPAGYPSQPPAAYVLRPKLKDSPHKYGRDGPLCLFNPQQGTSHGFDPACTTAAAVIAWAAEWLACYEVYQRTGEWAAGKPEH